MEGNVKKKKVILSSDGNKLGRGIQIEKEEPGRSGTSQTLSTEWEF